MIQPNDSYKVSIRAPPPTLQIARIFQPCQVCGYKTAFHCGINLHFPELMRLSIFSYIYWHSCYYYLFLSLANLICKNWCLIYISLITNRVNTFSYAYQPFLAFFNVNCPFISCPFFCWDFSGFYEFKWVVLRHEPLTCHIYCFAKLG